MSADQTPDAGASPAEPARAAAPGPAPITIDDFGRVELRAARVLAAEPHPDADRLLVLRVDAGDPEPRQLVAGIRADWAPEALVGRTIVIVANLAPARLRGVVSQGMLLAVRGTEKVLPLGVDGDVVPGTRVS